MMEGEFASVAERGQVLSMHFERTAYVAGFHRVRRRTSGEDAIAYPSIMELREGDMDSFGNKIFGAIIGSAIFFGLGVALAHAGSLIA